MLNRFYSSKAYIHHLRTGPLAANLDALASSVHESGYAAQYGRKLISYVDGFMRFAILSGAGKGPYDMDVVDRYRDQVIPCDRLAPTKSRFLVRHLKEMDLFQSEDCKSRQEAVCNRYADFLDHVQGLRPSTVRRYYHAALRFLRWLETRHPDAVTSEITAQDVLVYVQEISTPSTARALTNDLRSLLRYLHANEGLSRDLAPIVPRVPRWKHSSLPNCLPWDKIRHLVDSIDTSRAAGKRDKVIILLIACLGLRNQDIAHLELDDCNWRNGKIHVRKQKGRRERILPITDEVYNVLVPYVLQTRPKTKSRRVFLTTKAPYAPLAAASISSLIEKRLSFAGITGVRGASHLLRHSLASHLVNNDTPIKQVADLFGHDSIDTTAIYTKVDHGSLSKVAMPFPEEVL